MRGLSVGFSDNVVLKEVDLEIPHTGITVLVGPGGAGKSTLLRTLGRWNDMHPSFWSHGSVWLEGEDLLAQPLERAQRLVALLAQKARLYTATVLDNAIAEVRGEGPLGYVQKRELARGVLDAHGLLQELGGRLDAPVTHLTIVRQRMLALARLASGGARCILADEPLRDTEEDEREALIAFLERLAATRAMVMITHDQRLMRRLADRVCLLTGRRVVEAGPARDFFEHPRTALGRRFLESGNCWPEVPSAPPPAGTQPAWAPTEGEARHRPGGFHWVIPGVLGGMQWPGLLCDMRADLSELAQLGVRRMVTLTENPFPPSTLRQHGIEGLHFPIVDMDVPEPSAALALCRQISAWIDDGERVVLHCKAGLGRTGTMLACVLMYRGESAVRAIHRVRSVNPLYIQSERQLQFISELERFCA